jgi:hypothetical protein
VRTPGSAVHRIPLHQAKLGAMHDEDLRQLVHRYQYLAEGQL